MSDVIKIENETIVVENNNLCEQFPILHALRAELSWTHYRSLIRVENPKAREVYMNEATDNAWSTRFLDQQVDKHYL